jgi:hypothetical protein
MGAALAMCQKRKGLAMDGEIPWKTYVIETKPVISSLVADVEKNAGGKYEG